jgi:HEAT repeats
VWPTILFFLASGAAVWLNLQPNRVRQRLWQDAAAACGLTTEECSSVWKGRSGQLEVSLEATGRRGENSRVVVVVPGPSGFSNVKIRRELYQSFWKSEIEVGDEAFDGAFFVEGPAKLVHALLDGEARRLMLGVNAKSPLEVKWGTLQAEASHEQVREILSLLLTIGRRFAQRVDVEQRLAENARGDPAAGVRLQNLLLLIRELPGTPGTVETLRAACADPSPAIRLLAAQALGAEGHDVLVALAESTEDDASSGQALLIVGRDLPFERTSAILIRALRRRQIQTARACLKVLGSRGGEAAVDTLAKVLEREEGVLAVAAAAALGEAGGRKAEPPLIQALEHEDTDDRIAAADALCRVGTVAAVLPLQEAAESKPYHSGLRRAARQAIAAIQTRLPGASPGQLSLAGAEAGHLSLAQVEAGELSLAADPDGQLSLLRGEARQPAAKEA